MGLPAALLDLLAPPRCPACGAPAAQVWCGDCLRELGVLALPGGAPVVLADGVRAAAAYAYEGAVRDTLLAVKVRGRHAALSAMGSLLRVRLGLPEPRPGVALTWVPASRAGLKRRGVDVAKRLAGPRAVPLLRRAREGMEQKHLGGHDRRHAARGAFIAVGRAPAAVVVVDDVRTTGATALAAAGALQAAGARRVLVATFAAVDGPLPPPGAETHPGRTRSARQSDGGTHPGRTRSARQSDGARSRSASTGASRSA